MSMQQEKKIPRKPKLCLPIFYYMFIYQNSPQKAKKIKNSKIISLRIFCKLLTYTQPKNGASGSTHGMSFLRLPNLLIFLCKSRKKSAQYPNLRTHISTTLVKVNRKLIQFMNIKFQNLHKYICDICDSPRVTALTTSTAILEESFVKTVLIRFCKFLKRSLVRHFGTTAKKEFLILLKVLESP